MHHGDAVAPEVDAQRPLSAQGAADAAKLAAEAARRGVRPAAVWHSGKLRARQTAETFWRACNPLAEFAAVHGLQPADSPHWICDRVAGEVRDIMCVGHFPNIPHLRRALLGDAAAEAFPLNGMSALEQREDGGWNELWHLGPREL